MYDYGARNYDQALGRWINIDNLAEKYPHVSQYSYVANNPIYFVDPDGQRIVVASEGDRESFLSFLHQIFGDGNFSFNDSNELQFVGNIKKCKGDLKDTINELTEIIGADYDVNVKLSNFSEEENSLLEINGGAYTSMNIQLNKKGKFEKVVRANVFLNVDGLEDVEFYERKYRFRDSKRVFPKCRLF